jgi:RNA recognition motif-containing protein
MCRIENNRIKVLQEPSTEDKQKHYENTPTSRLIVFNVPTYYTKEKLADRFWKKGHITDLRITREFDKSRKFEFIEFENKK